LFELLHNESGSSTDLAHTGFYGPVSEGTNGAQQHSGSVGSADNSAGGPPVVATQLQPPLSQAPPVKAPTPTAAAPANNSSSNTASAAAAVPAASTAAQTAAPGPAAAMGSVGAAPSLVGGQVGGSTSGAVSANNNVSSMSGQIPNSSPLVDSKDKSFAKLSHHMSEMKKELEIFAKQRRENTLEMQRLREKCQQLEDRVSIEHTRCVTLEERLEKSQSRQKLMAAQVESLQQYILSNGLQLPPAGSAASTVPPSSAPPAMQSHAPPAVPPPPPAAAAGFAPTVVQIADGHPPPAAQAPSQGGSVSTLLGSLPSGATGTSGFIPVSIVPSVKGAHSDSPMQPILGPPGVVAVSPQLGLGGTIFTGAPGGESAARPVIRPPLPVAMIGTAVNPLTQAVPSAAPNGNGGASHVWSQVNDPLLHSTAVSSGSTGIAASNYGSSNPGQGVSGGGYFPSSSRQNK
jgi:hypothetical protein